MKLIVVEPENSRVISGGTHSPHMIQGIGAGFVPDTLDTSLIDELLAVSDQEALEMARKLVKFEAIPGGISSGAMTAAALRVAARDEMAGKTVVTVLPSFAERYQTTALFEGINP